MSASTVMSVGHGKRRSARSLDLACHRFEIGTIARRDHYRRARRGKSTRDRLADALARPGDDGDTVLKLLHVPTILSISTLPTSVQRARPQPAA